MATSSIPAFRSLSQMVGSMAGTFLSELDSRGIVPGIQSLKPGSPYLAIFEAVGQSQFRNQEQTLTALDANDIDIAHKERLDRIGESEKLPRRGATFASGVVTIGDSSFTKASTKIYQGKAAPISGSTTIYVNDASAFPLAGSLYIGRSTPNLEGPLAYTARTNLGSYWSITLAAGAVNFHGLGETVVLAQGGDRVISSGQAVQTPQGNFADAAQFVTTSSATLLDGETSVSNVPVTCRQAGPKGSVPAGAIKVVSSPAFTGMTVTNPLPVTNGFDIEDDDHYRDRIKTARRARQGKGTPLGLAAFTYGVEAPDEASTVVSSLYVSRKTLPSLLVIDDGTGYEEKNDGIAFEVLIDSAVGGEMDFFLVRGRPVAKASATTIPDAPYVLSDQSVLSVIVGGAQSAHAFSADQFADISNATAYEVVASINADPNIPYYARTTGSGKRVAVFAKANTLDDIQVSTALSGVDANKALNFPLSRVDSVRLYKNDILLSKDGQNATLSSTQPGAWAPMASGETLTISVDNTPYITFAFADSDVVALGGSYTTISSSLPLDVWAALINAKVPGVTASVAAGALQLTSNLGADVRAVVSVGPTSTLAGKGMFSTLVAQGRSKDYVLDRNNGQISLLAPLQPNDRLTAGTSYTRAYVQTSALANSLTVASPGLHVWFVPDGAATLVRHRLTSSNTVSQAWTTTSRTYTTTGAPFVDVRPGDWVIFAQEMYNPAVSPATLGHVRVSDVDPSGNWFKTESAFPWVSGVPAASGTDSGNLLPAYQSIFFCRTDAVPRHLSAAAGTYSPATLAAALTASAGSLWASGIEVTTPTVAASTRVRFTTNTYSEAGDLALAAQNAVATTFGLSATSAIGNDVPERAAVESGNSEAGTPRCLAGISWYPSSFQSTPRGVVVGTFSSPGGVTVRDGFIQGGQWLRAPSTSTNVYWGADNGDTLDWSNVTGGYDLIDHSISLLPRATIDRLAPISRFRLGPISNLNVVFDNDPVTKGFTIPMSRWLKPDVAVPYGQSIRLKDADNVDGGGNPQSLALAFGTSFNFANFALHTHAQGTLVMSATQPGNTDSALFRVKDWWGRSVANGVSIVAPNDASSALSVSSYAPGDVAVALASGAPHVSVSAGTALMAGSTSTSITVLSGFDISSISRAAGVTVTVQLTMPSADIVGHGFTSTQSVYVSTTDVNFPSGYKTITVTGSTTFTYQELNAFNGAGSIANAWVAPSSTPTDFSAAVVGDILSFPSGTYWGKSELIALSSGYTLTRTRSASRVTAVSAGSPKRYIRVSNAPFNNVAFSQSWATVSAATDFRVSPLSGNTTSAVVASINALTSSSITATLVGGPGTGTIGVPFPEAAARAPWVDGTLLIGASAYNGGASNYDITLKTPPAGSGLDWTNAEFRLVPTTALNVADYVGRGQVTGLASAGVGVQASARGRKVQLASGTAGSGGYVQVTGGNANRVQATVVGTAVAGSLINVTVARTADTDAISNKSAVMLDNSQPTPKTLNWTSSTTLTAANGLVSVGVAGSAWSANISFGGKYLVEKVGSLVAITPSHRGALTTTLPAIGDLVRMDGGYGAWSLVGSGPGRLGASVVTLADGRVLVIGGADRLDLLSAGMTANVYMYDPATGAWTSRAPIGNSAGNTRSYGSASLLADGRVLYCGGWSADGVAPVAAGDAWTYNVTTDTWTAVGAMNQPRAHHTATVLSAAHNGNVVIAGGVVGVTYATVTNTAEVFAPGADVFVITNSMAVPRAFHVAKLFGDDKVLVVGGASSGMATYEYFSIDTTVWTSPSVTSSVLPSAGCAVVALSSTSFLVTGGSAAATSANPGAWSYASIQGKCEVFDTASLAVTSVGAMALPRAGHSLVALSASNVVAIGGIGQQAGAAAGQARRSTEIYSTASGAWVLGSGSYFAHAFQDPIRVSNGTVLMATAMDSFSPGFAVANASETFDPASASAPAGNVGTFRVLAVNTGSFLIENASAVEGEWSFGLFGDYTADSVLPGDSLHISTSAFGVSSMGGHTIVSTDLFDQNSFRVGDALAFSTATLGTDLPLVSILPSAPARMLYEVAGITPVDSNPNAVTVSLTPATHPEYFSPGAGSVLTFRDKLEFSSAVSVGQDGYRYNTGLIGEVTKVVYGDARDQTTYPGLASAGAAIDVSAPRIRRTVISIAVRARSGAVDVKGRVQSAVARVINSAVPGPIAISLIVEEVQQVDGVVSVVMLSPVSSTSADTIPVQPGEKALVLDPSNDIQVTFIGA